MSDNPLIIADQGIARPPAATSMASRSNRRRHHGACRSAEIGASPSGASPMPRDPGASRLPVFLTPKPVNSGFMIRRWRRRRWWPNRRGGASQHRFHSDIGQSKRIMCPCPHTGAALCAMAENLTQILAIELLAAPGCDFDARRVECCGGACPHAAARRYAPTTTIATWPRHRESCASGAFRRDRSRWRRRALPRLWS